MSIYNQLLAMPISERTGHYLGMSRTEREYVNACAALDCQQRTLEIYKADKTNRHFSPDTEALVTGKIILLRDQVAALELQLPKTTT